MADIALIVNQLRNRYYEEEWFEFKKNWFEPAELGAYISALSNSAAMLGKDNAYFVWGIHDTTHEFTGTDFDYHRNVKNEPLEHYLARKITPDIGFSFSEHTLEGKHVVVLTIPAAKTVPTAFDGVRFMRIGSSKVNLGKYPERESKLFSILRNGLPTMETVEAHSQELSFRKLFLYYEDKGIILKRGTKGEPLKRIFVCLHQKENIICWRSFCLTTVKFRSEYQFSRDQTKLLHYIRSESSETYVF